MSTENPLAPRWRRLVCLFYEALLLTALLMCAIAPMAALMWLYRQLTADVPTGPAWSGFDFVYFVGVTYAYFAYCWQRSGQTLAMKTWRLRLVSNTYSISWQVMATRFAIVALTTVPLLVALVAIKHIGAHVVWLSLLVALSPYVWSFWDRDGQFLHDRIAGTHIELLPLKRAV